jgi:hypothetical protein
VKATAATVKATAAAVKAATAAVKAAAPSVPTTPARPSQRGTRRRQREDSGNRNDTTFDD